MTSIDSNLYENCKAAFFNYYLGLNFQINSFAEFITVLQMAGFNPPNYLAQKIWNENKESITLNRFCQAASKCPLIDEKRLMDNFKLVDRDSKGYLTRQELTSLLDGDNVGTNSSIKNVKMMLNELYFDGDRFYYEKFANAFTVTTEKLLNLMKRELKEDLKEKKLSDTHGKKGILKTSGSYADPSDVSSKGEKQSKPQFVKTLDAKSTDKLQYSLATLSIINKVNNTTFKIPRDFKKFSAVTLNGCFYYDANEVMWSHMYELKIMKKTSVTMYISPKTGDSKNTSFVFLLDQYGQVTATSNQKDQNGVYIDKVTLLPGTYTILPYTVHSEIKVQKDYKVTTLVNKGKDGRYKLSEKCLSAVTNAFETLDLNKDGYLDMLEFNFYHLLTSGEIVSQEEWKLLKNRGFASDVGVSLHDLINLLELELNANSGDAHDLWTSLILLGFDSSLNCVKSIPYEITCFTKNIKKIILEVTSLRSTHTEIVKVLRKTKSENIQKRTLPALTDFAAYSINTDLLILVIYDNQSKNGIEVKYNASDSQNLQPTNSRFSGSLRLTSKTISESFSYIIFNNVSEYRFTLNEVVRIQQ